MSVVFQEPNDGSYIVFVKGAVERIIDLCTYAGFGDYNQPMTEETRVDIIGQMNLLANQGLVSSTSVPEVLPSMPANICDSAFLLSPAVSLKILPKIGMNSLETKSRKILHL